MVESLQKVSGVPIPYQVGPRRPGDLAEVYADATAAQRELGWKVSRGLETMCRDMWRWQQGNPQGFKGEDEEAEDAKARGGSRWSERSPDSGLVRRMSLAAVFMR